MTYLLLYLLTSWHSPTICNSTVFGYLGDGYGGRTPTLLTGKPVTPQDYGIAHRTWKMGTRVKVQNVRTGATGYGVVLDRGPYGKKGKDGVWFNGARDKTREGKYLGCADLTPALAKVIGAKGRTRIRLWKERR